MRGFIFKLFVIPALPLVIVTWLIEATVTILRACIEFLFTAIDIVASLPLAAFILWWGFFLRVLPIEERIEYAKKWPGYLTRAQSSGVSPIWIARIEAFSKIATIASGV